MMTRAFFEKRFKKEDQFLMKQWSRLLTELAPFLFILLGAVGYFYQSTKDEGWVIFDSVNVIGIGIIVAVFLLRGSVHTHMEVPDIYYGSRQQAEIRQQFIYFWTRSLIMRIPIFIPLAFLMWYVPFSRGMGHFSVLIGMVAQLIFIQGIDFYIQLRAFEYEKMHCTLLRVLFIGAGSFLALLFPMFLISGVLFCYCAYRLYAPGAQRLALEKMVQTEQQRQAAQYHFFRWFFDLALPSDLMNVNSESRTTFQLPFARWIDDSAAGFYLTRTLARDRQLFQLLVSWFFILCLLLYAYAFSWLSVILAVAGLWLASSALYEKVVEKWHVFRLSEKEFPQREVATITIALGSTLWGAVTIILAILKGLFAWIYLLGVVVIFFNVLKKVRKNR
ncbi:ABC transporter permease [Allofustis seminis]|uniref:ABC transporter permease n=1 Tax=Allofustis seminis TaxID=166939 RepID=UPI00037FD2B2|nr:ABC transporter permease [Allofustis seminis]